MNRYFVARGETDPLTPETRAGLRGSFVPLSDGVTHYELCGPAGGGLVLLIPGLTVPLFYWDGLAAELHKNGFRTLAYSAYGRGFSDRLRTVYDEALFQRQALELLAALEFSGRWHIVGASMGALIGMRLLLRHPERTASMTLIGPAGLEQRPPLAARIVRTAMLSPLSGRFLGPRALLKHLDRNVRSNRDAERLQRLAAEAFRFQGSLHAVYSTLRSFPLTDRQELFRRSGQSGVPVQLLWGEEDRVTPITRLDEARMLLNSPPTHLVPECGHMAAFERPAFVGGLIATFLSQRSPDPAR